jgi:hypothetical protein
MLGLLRAEKQNPSFSLSIFDLPTTTHHSRVSDFAWPNCLLYCADCGLMLTMRFVPRLSRPKPGNAGSDRALAFSFLPGPSHEWTSFAVAYGLSWPWESQPGEPSVAGTHVSGPCSGPNSYDWSLVTKCDTDTIMA